MTRVIRDYRAEDEPALRALHARFNDPFAFPDLSSPLYIVKKVVEVDGQVTDAVLVRKTAFVTAYLGTVFDEQPSLIQALQTDVLASAWAAGVEDVGMFTNPDPIEAERMAAMGWCLASSDPVYSHTTRESPSLKAAA